MAADFDPTHTPAVQYCYAAAAAAAGADPFALSFTAVLLAQQQQAADTASSRHPSCAHTTETAGLFNPPSSNGEETRPFVDVRARRACETAVAVRRTVQSRKDQQQRAAAALLPVPVQYTAVVYRYTGTGTTSIRRTRRTVPVHSVLSAHALCCCCCLL